MMQEIIDQINKISGVHGTLIMSKDGIIVKSEVKSDLNENQISALVSSIGAASEKTVSQLELGAFSRFVMFTEVGRLIFENAGKFYLVAVADESVNLAMCLVEIGASVKKLDVFGDTDK